MADLTTVAAVKRYLGNATSNLDTLLGDLIPRNSRTIEKFTGRVFPAVTRTNKKLTGSGTVTLFLPDSPVVEVAALTIGGVTIPQSSNGIVAGYTNDDTSVVLINYGSFPMRPPLQVSCSWTAGYREQDSDSAIPSGNTPTLTPTQGGRAVSAVGVTSVAGISFTEVESGPAAGQFSLTPATGTFTFNSADSGTTVELDYYYIPGPVEQACIEMVALDLTQRTNVGVKSKTLANESVSYEDRGMTPSIKEMLQPFVKRTPG